jgi:hypothetical protein
MDRAKLTAGMRDLLRDVTSLDDAAERLEQGRSDLSDLSTTELFRMIGLLHRISDAGFDLGRALTAVRKERLEAVRRVIGQKF